MNEKERIYNKVKTIIRQDGQVSSYIGEDDFVSLVKGGISINFHLKHPSLDIENIFRTVKRTQKILHDRFSHHLEKIDIDIYDSKEEMRQDGRSRSRYASWIAGIYDGKVRVISEKEDEEPESLYIILTHEIIHLSVSEISNGHCPYWLDEGLAVYVSQDLPDEYLSKLKEALKRDKILPFEVLENPLTADTEEGIRQLAYAEVANLTEYLIETYGWDKVKSIIQQCARREIKSILGDMSLNYYLLEQGWKRWVRGKSA
jgi:hypothetical protein